MQVQVQVLHVLCFIMLNSLGLFWCCQNVIDILPIVCYQQILVMKKEINPVELDFLLRFPFKAGLGSPVDFLSNQAWGGIKVCDE